jgi:hypothetical protein
MILFSKFLIIIKNFMFNKFNIKLIYNFYLIFLFFIIY